MATQLYIRLTDSEVHHTLEVGDDVNVDYDKDHGIVGIEILDWERIEMANEGISIRNTRGQECSDS